MPISSALEILEPRIAPANLLNPRTILFTDADGDQVQVKFSKAVFTGDDAAQLAKANEVFKFDTGMVTHDTTGTQQLRLIDFTKFPTVASTGSTVNGVGLTITATQAGGGDGFVDIGAIKALGVGLGSVVIDGDLGQIDAGGAKLKVGVASLTVNSIGKRGIATQIPVPAPTADNPAPDLISTITGELTNFAVLTDVKEARVNIVDGRNAQSVITTAAKLGKLTIGGSLIGRAAAETASDNTGLIQCDRDIGFAKIGTDLDDGIVGGGGVGSGRINAGTTITNVIISGSVVGGAGMNSGMISSGGSLSSVRIKGDLVGGSGESSGIVRSFGAIGSLTIVDDIVSGTGAGSGFATAAVRIEKLMVKGDIDGRTASAGIGSGGVYANGLPEVTIQGSILGGSIAQTGFLESGRGMGAINVLGSVVGGMGDGSGAILARYSATSFSVAGSVLGGEGDLSGVLRAGLDAGRSGAVGKATIFGAIQGGDGNNSGSFVTSGEVKNLTIGTSATPTANTLVGGAGDFSGVVSARGIKTLTIWGNVVGSGGEGSGSLFSYDRSSAQGEFAGDFGIVTISGKLSGGLGDDSGSIRANGGITSLSVAAIEGGIGQRTGTLHTGTGSFSAGDVGTITITGPLAQAAATPGADSATLKIGGALTQLSVGGITTGAAIHAGDSIGTLKFAGDVSNVVVTARGQAVQGATTDVAISRIAALADVDHSSFLAGYDPDGNAVNPDAQIGMLKVVGNWTASNLVAGVAAGTDAGFGNALDVKAPGDDSPQIVSKIASIVIGGSVNGSSVAGEHFGFVAQFVAKAQIGTTLIALDATANSQSFDVGTGVTIREVPLS